ncbi:transposase [Clostridium ragsdalei P11]|uniref:Transposase n=1 Tax=Clostridium ragsdalei P11 TaxID=1353534 RepID=A0A1A6AKU1_9CLOT|nr:transposase [Clostridium ragsdalei]OBR90608.1 transposase [Clostridium ragsdalei P11]
MNFIRKYTEEERVKMVEEALQYGSNSLVAAKHNINPVLLSRWKSCYRKYGQTLMQKKSKELDSPIPDYKKQCALLAKEKKELELEIAVLKDMLKKKI